MKDAGQIEDRTAVATWMEHARALDASTIELATLCDSRAWSFRDGAIRHRSDRFFNVVGLGWRRNGDPRNGIFIEQREIGVLGFVARAGADGLELLVHAKAEPGNVGGIQLAPTFQATQSNSDRVHGGSLPPYTNYFRSQAGETICDTLQSEHGMRFLGKLNRNVFIVDPGVEASGAFHRWIPSRLVLAMLAEDFIVNTDARSVLFCADWKYLANNNPFSSQNPFVRDLSGSLAAAPRPAFLVTIAARLKAMRDDAPPVEYQDVSRLDGWRFKPESPTILTNGIDALWHITVSSRSREVALWDQPILADGGESQIELHCGHSAAGFVFAFRPTWEPGLLHGAELAPTRVGPLTNETRGAIRAKVRQSEEGGRFFRNTATYLIVDVGDVRDDDSLAWLTLSEIDVLKGDSVFNNESRSVVSLLLQFL